MDLYYAKIKTCSDIYPAGGGVNDEYKLYIGGQIAIPIKIYCFYANFTDAGSEYVTLHRKSHTKYCNINLGKGCNMKGLTVDYTKVRIDPQVGYSACIRRWNEWPGFFGHICCVF
jgi:hypothetical protein